jgi:hypothetical protein
MKIAIFCIYLGESKQKPSDGRDHNAAHQKGDMLRPECYVNIDSNPVDCYFHTSCNWIFLSHTIKNNVDSWLQKEEILNYIDPNEFCKHTNYGSYFSISQ